MDGERIVGALTSLTPHGMPVIAHAARTGNVGMFVEVRRSMAKHLRLEQVRSMFCRWVTFVEVHRQVDGRS